MRDFCIEFILGTCPGGGGGGTLTFSSCVGLDQASTVYLPKISEYQAYPIKYLKF